jgi:hypothetical protein
MALVYDSVNHLTCLSTDTKPTTLPTNFIAQETDTYIEWIWNGTSWRMKDPFLQDIKKYGSQSMQHIQGDGLFNNMTNSGMASGWAVDTTLKRKYIRMSTTTTITTTVGWCDSTNSNTTTNMNPRLYCEFRLNQTTNQRIYIGFRQNATPFTGDDPLNALWGFLFGARSTSSVWEILSNDGTGATVTAAVTAVTTIDTGMHKVWVVSDSGNSQFGVSIDGNAFQYVSTAASIPAATLGLVPHIEIQNSAAENKQMDVFNLFQVVNS